MEVVTAGAQEKLMQSLDYKLKTSNTNCVTARHDVQYFPSSLSSFSFSPATSRVCRIPLTSGTSFIDPESLKIAFRVKVFANGQRCDDINCYGRTVAACLRLEYYHVLQQRAPSGTGVVQNTVLLSPPDPQLPGAGRPAVTLGLSL